MKRRLNIFSGAALAVTAAAAAIVSCGKLDDVVDTAQVNIVRDLQNKNIYERGNLPEELDVSRIMGYYDIVGGAYRYVVNEYVAGKVRPDRDSARLIHPGDSISFYFDARIFYGSFESATTFYTNIASRRTQISGDNLDFDTDYEAWPVVPIRIKTGDDPKILKSLQTALISCRAGIKAPAGEGGGDDGNENPSDNQAWKIASDQVRVYLTPDIAFGSPIVYNVPGNSTLVFEVTDIEIID